MCLLLCFKFITTPFQQGRINYVGLLVFLCLSHKSNQDNLGEGKKLGVYRIEPLVASAVAWAYSL